MARYPKDLLERIEAIKSRRPRLVLEHILKYGSVTTEELRETYGYEHAPRAARDVRESGIPLKTKPVIGKSGRRIARYEIDVDQFNKTKQGTREGRRAAPSILKRRLASERGPVCELCLSSFASERPLQVDHRVPYEIGGDPKTSSSDLFMLVCAPCNRTKSWQCEHCPNWTKRNREVCRSCFWASPSDFEHVATVPSEVVVVQFQAKAEGELLKSLRVESQRHGETLEAAIKRRLRAAPNQQ